MRYILDTQSCKNGTEYELSLFDEDELIGAAQFYTGFGSGDHVLTIANVIIIEEFQGKGYGKELYRAISEVYHTHCEGYKVKRDFVDIRAYKLAIWAIKERLFPEESWNPDLVNYSKEVLIAIMWNKRETFV